VAEKELAKWLHEQCCDDAWEAVLRCFKLNDHITKSIVEQME